MTDAIQATEAPATEAPAEAPEAPTPAQSRGSMRDELIAAAKAAREPEEASAEADAPEGEAPDAEPAKVAEPPKEDGDDLKAVTKALREREKRREAEVEISQAKAEAKAALEEAKAEREAAKREREEWQALMKSKPADAIKAAGWDPESLVMNLARDGSPEAAAEREMMAMRAKLDAFERWQKAQEEGATRQQQEAKQQAESQRIRAAEQEFAQLYSNAERFPTLAALYSDDQQTLVAQAHRVANEYAAKTGQYATIEQITAHLEDVHAERVARVRPRGAAPADSGTKPPPSGARTLSPDAASERRGGYKPLEEMTPQERKRELVAIAKKARAGG